MPGKTDDTGAATMPANAASATPAAKTKAWIQRMSRPSEVAISGFDAAARIIMPKRVFCIVTYISAASARHTAEMNSRYTGYDSVSVNGSDAASAAGIATLCTSSPTTMLRSSSKIRIRPKVSSTW